MYPTVRFRPFAITNLTVQRRIRGIPTRLWQLKADFLGCDDCYAGAEPA
jgi:hypothetical protein